MLPVCEMVQIAFFENGESRLVTYKRTRRGLKYKARPLGLLRLDLCKIPRLRLVK